MSVRFYRASPRDTIPETATKKKEATVGVASDAETGDYLFTVSKYFNDPFGSAFIPISPGFQFAGQTSP